MSFLSNAHTHTDYCDGVSAIDETLAQARRLGFVSLGFSGHACQGFDPAYSMSPDAQQAYFARLRALQAQSAPPRIWAGLELDALALPSLREQAFAQADYILESTHYLERQALGASPAVDGDPLLLKRYVMQRLGGDGLALARLYYDIQVEALLRDRPHIIGHFDLVRKYARRLGLFDEHGEPYRALACAALRRARACGAVLEVNTGAMARGTMETPYPSLELLRLWRTLDGEVTVTSDCHDARLLDHGFDQALALIRQAGFTSLLRLGTGEALWERVAV